MNGAAAIPLPFSAVGLALFYVSLAPVDVRPEMHRTALGWAAWLPARRRYLPLAAVICLLIGSILSQLLVTDDPLANFFVSVWLAALFVAALATARPVGVIVDRDGVIVRRVREIRVDWPEIERNHWALAAAGLRGMTTDPIAADGGRAPRGRVRLHRLDVAPQRVIDVIVYFRDHPEARATLGAGAPMPAELAESA